jgi:hypothetical protein
MSKTKQKKQYIIFDKNTQDFDQGGPYDSIEATKAGLESYIETEYGNLEGDYDDPDLKIYELVEVATVSITKEVKIELMFSKNGEN